MPNIRERDRDYCLFFYEMGSRRGKAVPLSLAHKKMQLPYRRKPRNKVFDEMVTAPGGRLVTLGLATVDARNSTITLTLDGEATARKWQSDHPEKRVTPDQRKQYWELAGVSPVPSQSGRSAAAAARSKPSGDALTNHSDDDTTADILEIIDQNPDPTIRTAEIKLRLCQGQFRADLDERWDCACAVTGCTVREVLRASHIWPWRKASDQERRDPANGILLIANLDALFDRGLISFSDNGNLIVSSKVSSSERRHLGLDIPRKIRSELTAREKVFLVRHRSLHGFS